MKKIAVISLVIFLCGDPCYAQVTQRQAITFAGKAEAQPVARAFADAPNVVTKCKGSIAAGAQFADAGVTFGGTYDDDECVIFEMIKLGVKLGRVDEANHLYTLQYERLIAKFVKEEKPECDYPTKCRRK